MNKQSCVYESHKQKSTFVVSNYNKTAQALYRYLAFRDLSDLIHKNVFGKIALDYGSGTGISTQFLLDQNLSVKGVDKSKRMLELAKKNCPGSEFFLSKKGVTPFDTGLFDLIFSSFVLFELSTKADIILYMKEAYRIMKPKGTFIAITGSQKMYSKNWLCLRTSFPENKNLESGNQVKVLVPETNTEFTDYYWTEADYCECFSKANFKNVEIFYPLGKSNEPYLWQDEKEHSPFVIFVAKIN